MNEQFTTRFESPTIPWDSDIALNPAVRAWREMIAGFEKEAIAQAEFALTEQLGRLSENPEVYAHLSAVFIRGGENLHPVAMHNYGVEFHDSVSLDHPSLVGMAARQQKSVYLADVMEAHGLPYVEISPCTRSELVVPIRWDGELLGVINLESRSKNGLRNALAVVEDAIPAMIAELLVLKSCMSKGVDYCPWHPDIHGWDLSKQFSKLLQRAARELSGASPKFTIWYLDREKEQLSAYATYGYDWCYVDGATIHLLHSQIGQAMEYADGIKRLDVDSFVRADKARELGIEEAWLVPCWSDESGGTSAAITCYFTEKGSELDAVDENDRELTKAALVKFAAFLGEFIRSFRRQLFSLGRATVSAVNCSSREQPKRTRYEEWLAVLLRILAAPVGSVFQLRSETRLQCVASTGFYNLERYTRSGKLGDHFYELTDPRQSHTVTTLYLADKSIRRNCLGDAQEKGLPSGTPVVADFYNNAEFVLGQMLGNRSRRLLSCAFRIHGEVVGVVRLVRAKSSRPFSKCHSELIELLCRELAPDCMAKFALDEMHRKVIRSRVASDYQV